MQLTVQERLALLMLLPQVGDFATLKVVRELREDLSFSDEEHEALQFKHANENQVTWENDNDPMKEFSFGWKQERVIRETLEKVNSDKKLGLDHISLYEKFMEVPDGDGKEEEHESRANGRSPTPIGVR